MSSSPQGKRLLEKSIAHRASALAKIAAIGATTLGVANPSIGSILGSAAGGESFNLPLMVGGAATFACLKLADAQFLRRQNQTFREGIHNEVDAPNYTPFAKTLLKNDLFRAGHGAITAIRHALDKYNTSSDIYSTEVFDRNSINIVHALALIGQDRSYDAQELRSRPEFREQAIQDVFDDSETLMKIMRPNEDSLFKFSEAVRKSLGQDAEYILGHMGNDDIKSSSKYSPNQNKVKKVWNEIFDIARDGTAEDAQKANYHHEFAKTVTIALKHSVDGTLTPGKAKKLIEKFNLYQPLLKTEELGSPEYRTAEAAVAMKNTINRMLRLSAGRPLVTGFHQAEIFKNSDINLLLIADHDPSSDSNRGLSARKLINLTKAALMEWVEDVELKPVHTLFTERLFQTLVEKAEKNINDKGYTEPSHYKGDREKMLPYAHARLKALGWSNENRINDMTPRSAAEHVVKNVQQRVAQAVVDKKVDYGVDSEQDSSIRRVRR